MYLQVNTYIKGGWGRYVLKSAYRCITNNDRQLLFVYLDNLKIRQRGKSHGLHRQTIPFDMLHQSNTYIWGRSRLIVADTEIVINAHAECVEGDVMIEQNWKFTVDR